MTRQTELLERYRTVGNSLDSATDPEAMRFLLRGRKALTAALEAARPAPLPGRTVRPETTLTLYREDLP